MLETATSTDRRLRLSRMHGQVFSPLPTFFFFCKAMDCLLKYGINIVMCVVWARFLGGPSAPPECVATRMGLQRMCHTSHSLGSSRYQHKQWRCCYRCCCCCCCCCCHAEYPFAALPRPTGVSEWTWH